MNKVQIETPLLPNLTRVEDWTEIEPLIFQRPCIGQEHSASYNQNVADGHTELSVSAPFSINCSCKDLINRTRKAWLRGRYLHPESAVELSTDLAIPQMMTYHHLLEGNKDAIRAWMDETFVVVKDRSYEEVAHMTYNRRLPTRGKASMLYLVIDSRFDIQDDQRFHAIIWNVSHAITDAFSIVAFLNSLLTDIARNVTDSDVFQDEQTDIVQHLPISPLVTYEKLYKPTQAERIEALAQANDQLALYKDKSADSVAMYSESDFTSRNHGTHCLITSLKLQESTRILRSLKQAQVGITYLGAAATIWATYQLYGRGHETGALLGMTRNARRWVATVLSDTGRTAIPMATDVVFLWIPFANHLEAYRNDKKRLLLSLGQEIKIQLNKHLTSPHYLSSVPYMSKMFVDGLIAQEAQNRQDTLDPKKIVSIPSAPGFSSQGTLAAKRLHTWNDTTLVRHDIIHTGRQVGTSPWIGLNSLDQCLRFSIGFDTKYYKVEKMEVFLDLVRENVKSIADDIPCM